MLRDVIAVDIGMSTCYWWQKPSLGTQQSSRSSLVVTGVVVVSAEDDQTNECLRNIWVQKCAHEQQIKVKVGAHAHRKPDNPARLVAY